MKIIKTITQRYNNEVLNVIPDFVNPREGMSEVCYRILQEVLSCLTKLFSSRVLDKSIVESMAYYVILELVNIEYYSSIEYRESSCKYIIEIADSYRELLSECDLFEQAANFKNFLDFITNPKNITMTDE